MTALFTFLLYYGSLLVLVFFSCHRLYLLWLLRTHPEPPSCEGNESHRPFVTVQIPVYNERYVVGRVLDSLRELRYPRACIELQLLDDSTDDTSSRLQHGLARLRADGWRVTHLRRHTREGFKAGALAAGLTRARGEFLLLLDADFVATPDLLERLLPPMRSGPVAMVQARWGHLNAKANRLTDVQALLLDAHFLLETAARARAGLFFNFHGTAALWRKAAIVDAGGWQSDTLTEDLDLSYRAQLRGWRFVYLPGLVVPAELPETLAAFKQQQARWAEGTVATARKHLSAIARAKLRTRIKSEAFVHLLAHAVYPAALLVSLLALPALLFRRAYGIGWLGWTELVLALLVILPTRVFFRRAARLAGRKPPGFREVPMLLMTGMALAVSNSCAVLRGLRRRRSVFVRTPKTAGNANGRHTYTSVRQTPLRLVEGSLALYLFIGLAVAVNVGVAGAAPAFAFLALAFGNAALRS